jgi:hypothetical protein
MSFDITIRVVQNDKFNNMEILDKYKMTPKTESANEHEHVVVQDDLDANCASYVEDRHLEDATCVLDKLLQRKQGFLCLSIELKRRGRIFGGTSSGLECPLEIGE